MKLEMNEDSARAVIIVSVCVAVVFIGYLFYLDDILPYKAGYTQTNMVSTVKPVWIKP